MENIQNSVFKKRKITLNNEKLILYLSLFIVLFMIYRNSWLPGGLFWETKEIFIVLFFVVLLILLVLDFNKLFYYKISFKSEYYGIILLFLIGFFSVLINISDEFNSIYNIIRFIIFIFYLFLFFHYLPTIIQKNNLVFVSIVRFYSILGLLIGSIGIVMYILGYVPYDLYSFNTKYISIIIHPNYVSFLLTTTIVTTLFYLLDNTDKFNASKNIFYTASFIIQLISQLLTLSRGGIIGTSIGILFMSIFFFRGKIIIALPVIIIFIYYSISTIFQSKGSLSNFSRYLLLIPVYYMVLEKNVHTFFGFGVTNSFKAYNDYRINYGVLEQVNNPHNTILSIFIMFGIIFTICLLIFFIGLIFKGFVCSVRAKEKSNKLFYGFLTANTLALFSHGIFDSALIMPEYFNMQFFLICLGLLFIYTRGKNKFSYANDINDR